MPATKLEMLVKMLRKQITEYGKTNQMLQNAFRKCWRKPSSFIMNAESI